MRIQIIEKFFEDVTERNADDPACPPMNYADQKEMLKDILVGYGFAPVPAVEHAHYLTTGGDTYAAMSGAQPAAGYPVRWEQDYGGAGAGAQPGQLRGRGGRGNRPPRGGGQPGAGRGLTDRVGRYPGDWKKCVTAGGESICVAFQMGRCKK